MLRRISGRKGEEAENGVLRRVSGRKGEEAENGVLRRISGPKVDEVEKAALKTSTPVPVRLCCWLSRTYDEAKERIT